MKQRLLVSGLLLTLALGTGLAAEGLGPSDGSGVRLGGYAIFENVMAVQTSRVLNDGSTQTTNITNHAGPWWQLNDRGSRVQINFNYDKDGFSFASSFRLDESTLATATASSQSNSTSSSYLMAINPLNTANVTFKLLDGNLKLRTGMYQEEGLGFDMNTYAMGIVGRYLASNHGGGTDSIYLTSLEADPEFVPGLAVLFGVPIEPNTLYGNADTKSSKQYWASNVYKRFRLSFKYDLPDVGLIRGYYYNNLWSYTTDPTVSGFKMNVDGDGLNEYMLGIENMNYFGVQWKFAYLLEHQKAAVWDSMKHNLIVSSKFSPLPKLNFMVDNMFTVFNKSYITNACVYSMSATGSDGGAQTVYADTAEWSDGKLGLVDKLQVNLTYDFRALQFGLLSAVIYEPFSNGHTYIWGQPAAELVAANGYSSGDVGAGSEWTLMANPYVQLNMGQGNIKVGLVEMYDRKTVAGKTTSAYSWQVPVTFFCWF